jgi:hypothetical protein
MDEKKRRRMGIPRPGGDCVAPGKKENLLPTHLAISVLFKANKCFNFASSIEWRTTLSSGFVTTASAKVELATSILLLTLHTAVSASASHVQLVPSGTVSTK